MKKTRREYGFSDRLKLERLNGCNFTCEHCGKITKRLEVHHLVACYLAGNNISLTPGVIKTIENAMCLCKDCHRKADDDHKTWDAHEIGLIAWALFDLDPKKVARSQRRTYLNR